MPTVPFRHMAESFGGDAARYDRARPPYPEALIKQIASPGADVLDVGCGTGIAARQCQAAGCTVLGVEPDTRMAEFARQSGLDVEVATFEDWAPAGRTFDIVTAGQSWHWVDQVTGTAKAAAVLRPGGRLAIFAHVFAPPPEVAHASATAYQRVAPDSPFARSQQPNRALDVYQAGFTKVATRLGETDEFDQPQQWRFDWTRQYTRDEWLDLLPTTGGLTWLPPGAVTEILDEVAAAIDVLGGGFSMSYTTLAVVAARTTQT
jgi:SAM-dependent methyltransferase